MKWSGMEWSVCWEKTNDGLDDGMNDGMDCGIRTDNRLSGSLIKHVIRFFANETIPIILICSKLSMIVEHKTYKDSIDWFAHIHFARWILQRTCK